MPQPIAVDKEIFEEIFSNIDDGKYSEMLNSITKLLRQFHEIVVNKTDAGKSDWEEFMDELKHKFNSPIVSYFIDALLSPANLKFIAKPIANKNDAFTEHVNATPDKIGLSEKIRKVKINGAKIFRIKEFVSEEYSPINNLFRLNKNVTVKPDFCFSNFKFLAPYLRSATKLEFADKQLFKDTRTETEVNFLLEIIKQSENLKQLGLIWEPAKINVRFNEFVQKAKEIHPGINIKESKQYKTRSKNHDRFIIVDHDKISIRFSTSFNNFYFNEKENKYCSKAGFRISYERGRQFYD